MRELEIAAGLIFLAGLASCASGGSNETQAGANLGANSAAPTENATAQAGPCPFETRNWRASITSEAEINPGSTDREPRIALTGEIRPGSGGHMPMMSSQDTPPPTIFLDLTSDSPLPPTENRDWAEATSHYNYVPGHVEAAVRCNGREIARVPIPAPARR